MTLYYAIVSEEVCSNIDTLIPSKYVGEMTRELVGFARRELKFHSSGDRESNFDPKLCIKVIFTYLWLTRMKSKNLNKSFERIYIYKDLQESDLFFITISMKILKMFSYDENDKEDIELIHEYSSSHNEVLDFLAKAKSHERSAKLGITESIQEMDKKLLDAREELEAAKEATPKDFFPPEFIAVINAAIENPKILIRSKKLVDLYFDKHEALTNLRFQ